LENRGGKETLKEPGVITSLKYFISQSKILPENRRGEREISVGIEASESV